MSEIVYLNEQFLAKEDAKNIAKRQGFVFADGVYEVVKYYNGKAFRYHDHFRRLLRSLAEVEIDYTETHKLESVFSELLTKK